MTEVREEVELTTVTVTDMVGGALLTITCSSVDEIRVKAAECFGTLTPCIHLLSSEGSGVMDDRWRDENAPPSESVQAIYDTSLTMEDLPLGEWFEVLETHVKYGDDAAIDRSRDFLSENGAYELMYRAAGAGAAELLQLLVAKLQLDTNRGNGGRQTALHLASEGGHTSTVEFLLSFPVDLDARDGDGNTPLHMAAEDEHGRIPLHYAAVRGHTSTVEMLLRFAADAGAEDVDGRTPLHLAARGGHTEIVELILRSPVDSGARDEYGMTPLHYAARRGHTLMVEMLLRFPVDAEVRDVFGMTPLHTAAFEGHASTVELLLRFAVDADAEDVHGRTPLHLAAQQGHTSTVELLKQESLARQGR